MKIYLYILFLFFSLGALSLSAQTKVTPVNPEQENAPVTENPTIDTIQTENLQPVDTLRRYTMEELMIEKDEALETTPMEKDPMGAVYRSLAVPGWGQIYTEDYWKAPLFFGGAVTLYGLIVYNNIEFIEYKKRANEIEDRESPEYKNLANYREFYRSNRDQAGLYLLGVYILSAIDAYVGAHLFNFDVSEDLSFKAIPNQNGGVNLSITYYLK